MVGGTAELFAATIAVFSGESTAGSELLDFALPVVVAVVIVEHGVGCVRRKDDEPEVEAPPVRFCCFVRCCCCNNNCCNSI